MYLGLTVFDFLSARDIPWQVYQNFYWFWGLKATLKRCVFNGQITVLAFQTQTGKLFQRTGAAYWHEVTAEPRFGWLFHETSLFKIFLFIFLNEFINKTICGDTMWNLNWVVISFEKELGVYQCSDENKHFRKLLVKQWKNTHCTSLKPMHNIGKCFHTLQESIIIIIIIICGLI